MTTSCSRTSHLWKTTKKIIATITGQPTNTLPEEILIYPSFTYHPEHLQNAVLWVLGQYLEYIVMYNSVKVQNSVKDLINFIQMRRTEIPTCVKTKVFGDLI